MSDLREALERLVAVYDGRSKPEDEDYDYEGQPAEGWEAWHAAMGNARAALATPAAEQGLDVERLARAIAIVHETDPAWVTRPTHSREEAAEHFGEWMLDATAIAREYAMHHERGG